MTPFQKRIKVEEANLSDVEMVAWLAIAGK
jgi:hypothetical protein